MITQFPTIYVDKLISDGMNQEDILKSIFIHSNCKEETEEFELFLFVMDSDMSTLDNTQEYSVDSNNETNH